MNSLLEKWNLLAEKHNARVTRERALIIGSALMCIYLIWDFAFYQPVAKEYASYELRLEAAKKDLVKLTAEEKVFTDSLQNDPGAAKKRELVRLQSELQKLNENLEQLAVGLISADKLPQVLYEVLEKSETLKFKGMQTRAPEKLKFDQGVQVVEESDEQRPENPENSGTGFVGVFKHAVRMNFQGDYFSVIRYLRRIENLEWKLYWNLLDYEVDKYPRGNVVLEVFTLSTEEGAFGE